MTFLRGSAAGSPPTPSARAGPYGLPTDAVSRSVPGRRGPPDIYVKDLGGSVAEQLLFEAPGLQAPSDWMRDGRFIAYVDYSPIRKAQSQIWLLPMTGAPKPVRLDDSPYSEYTPRFSPDSRFVAFVSEETGRAEVYVAALDGGRKQRVSPGAVPSRAGAPTARSCSFRPETTS